MKIFSNQSTIEILPDEILLEICKYLLCVDILQAFYGLNTRMTRMISQYYNNVSLYKSSIIQSTNLCMNILPEIGLYIRSLLIDRCYSVMQNDLFIKNFDKKMSILFPNLEKISLIAFRYEHLIDFLNILYNLNKLIEIRLFRLFEIDNDHQSNALRTLLQSNNNQLISILIDDESSCLSFNNIDCYTNILQLNIKLKDIKELSSLFVAVPNIRYLDVILDDNDSESILFDEINFISLLDLIDFRLKSTRRWWKLDELLILLNNFPNLQKLSLFLCTNDHQLIFGDILLPLILPIVQQFDYATYYFPRWEHIDIDTIISSWPSSHSIMCYSGNTFWLIHTLPWHFKRMSVLSSVGKTMSIRVKHETGYDQYVEHLEIVNNKNFPLIKSLEIIAKCHRIRMLSIWIKADGDTVQEEQQPPPPPPKPPCHLRLSHLNHIQFCPSLTVDVDDLSSIILAAPNLLRLDLPSDCLIHLLENEQMCYLLGKQITSLAIYNATDSSQVILTEEYIPLIAASLNRLQDLFVDLKHLTASVITTSNDIMSFSVESMILCLLSKFKQHKLISLCLDMQSSEMIKSDAKQWLQDNTILCEQQFDANYSSELQRLIIWM